MAFKLILGGSGHLNESICRNRDGEILPDPEMHEPGECGDIHRHPKANDREAGDERIEGASAPRGLGVEPDRDLDGDEPSRWDRRSWLSGDQGPMRIARSISTPAIDRGRGKL